MRQAAVLTRRRHQFGAGAAAVGSITLSWDAPTTMGDGSAASGITGYKIYTSTTPYDVDPPLAATVGNVLTTTLTNVPAGTYYVYVSAITSNGESPLMQAFNGDGVTGTPYWTI